jgi:hypothetical protein
MVIRPFLSAIFTPFSKVVLNVNAAPKECFKGQIASHKGRQLAPCAFLAELLYILRAEPRETGATLI